MFLKEAWYVAGWAREVTRAPTRFTILAEDIVIYRKIDGAVAALEDACPHRKLPLSMGRLKGDAIECGYHGLTFNCAGECIRVPGAERIPPGARVRFYPTAERYDLVWIWMGAPELADEDTIFTVEHWLDPKWGRNAGDAMKLDCNYLYITDNLLDPSHVSWVHPTSFGNEAGEETPMQIQTQNDGVLVYRWLKNVEPAPFYRKFLKFKGRADRKQHYEVRYPSHALIRAILVPTGTGDNDETLPADAFVMDSYNFLTPVDDNRTNYYWMQIRNFDPDSAAVTEEFALSVRAAFAEDCAILNAVYAGIQAEKTPHINLPIDAGPLRFRRLLDQKITEEQKGVAARAAVNC